MWYRKWIDFNKDGAFDRKDLVIAGTFIMTVIDFFWK